MITMEQMLAKTRKRREVKFVTRVVNIERTALKCPDCRTPMKVHRKAHRTLHEVGADKPTRLDVRYTIYRCGHCYKYHSPDMSHLAPKGSRYTSRVINIAKDLYVAKNQTLDKTIETLWRQYHVAVPPTTILDW